MQQWFKECEFICENRVMAGQWKLVLSILLGGAPYPIKRITFEHGQWKFTGQSGVTITVVLKKERTFKDRSQMFKPSKTAVATLKKAIQLSREWNDTRDYTPAEVMVKVARREVLVDNTEYTIAFTHVKTMQEKIREYIEQNCYSPGR